VIFIEHPEILVCDGLYCRADPVWSCWDEADEWERWTFADGWTLDLCPAHSEEVRKTTRTYADAVRRQRNLAAEYGYHRYMPPMARIAVPVNPVAGDQDCTLAPSVNLRVQQTPGQSTGGSC
jgi:hypothetical protein